MNLEYGTKLGCDVGGHSPTPVHKTTQKPCCRKCLKFDICHVNKIFTQWLGMHIYKMHIFKLKALIFLSLTHLKLNRKNNL